MRIAHIVTYVSPDGAFGGPVRVATAQAAALVRRGHDVTMYAAAPIAEPRVDMVNGVTTKLFPAHNLGATGFAGMRARGLTAALKRDRAVTDVAHVHLARDLVTLPAVRSLRRARIPYVAQTHGMVIRTSNPLAPFIDGIETLRALVAAHAVLTLTDAETREIKALAPKAATQQVRNGVEVADPSSYNGRPPLVLFMARLHLRKRPLQFVEMAIKLAPEFPDIRFVIAGPDEGEASGVVARIADARCDDRIQWIGPVKPEDTAGLMSQARVYVLPSVDEVFPMSLLEAFQAGTPAVVSDSLGIVGKCREYGAAVVTDASVAAIENAVRNLLNDTNYAVGVRDGGQRYLRSELDVDVVARDLESHYLAALESKS